MSKNFMVVGDVHLGKGLNLGRSSMGVGLNSRTQDQIKLLQFILNKCIENEIYDMVFTGDIFESPKPEYILLNSFISFLKECERNDIYVHIIAGNHDIKRTGVDIFSVLDILNVSELHNVKFYKDIETINGDGVSVTLMPFRDRKTLNVKSQQEAIALLSNKLDWEASLIPVENKKFIVGHLAIEGSIYVGDEIDDQYNEIFCPLSMFYGYDFTLMGHVHKQQTLKLKPYISHIGSLDLSDFGEANHNKYCCICSSDGIELIKLPTRKLIDLKIEIKEDKNPIEYIKEIMGPEINDSIVRLEIKNLSQKEINRKDVENLFYNSGCFYVSNIIEVRSTPVVPINKTVITDNTIEPKSAIKLWAENNKFPSENIKSLFLANTNVVLEKFNSSKK